MTTTATAAGYSVDSWGQAKKEGYESILDQQLEEAAAARIQAAQRSKLARRELDEEKGAASKIQAGFRGREVTSPRGSQPLRRPWHSHRVRFGAPLVCSGRAHCVGCWRGCAVAERRRVAGPQGVPAQAGGPEAGLAVDETAILLTLSLHHY